MREAPKRRLQAVHPKARFEQRLVVALTVVSDEDIKIPQVFFEAGQRTPFLVVVAHEKLAHSKAIRRDSPDPHQKSVRPRSSRQTCRLCIEKGPAIGRDRLYAAIA